MNEFTIDILKKLSRADITRILKLETMSMLQRRYRVYEEVSVSKSPAIIPKAWDEKYHIDICAMEYQRHSSDKPFLIEGFEIKSCRADFKSDKKWRNYLGRTDRFHFVTVEDVISPDEAGEAGLYYLSDIRIVYDTYIVSLKQISGSITFSVGDVERFDTMYGLAIANERELYGHRDFQDRIDKLIRHRIKSSELENEA